jgi:hypothetical protein
MFYQPEDSKLRPEIKALWKRRKEQSVIDLLSPFVSTDDISGHYISFQNTAMRWKCSTLTDEVRQEVQDWIDENLLEKEDDVAHPWKATQGDDEDELVAENRYIQGYVSSSPLAVLYKLTQTSSCIDALPSAIDQVLEQIEHSTGMKAVILIGGPAPTADGDFSTH